MKYILTLCFGLLTSLTSYAQITSVNTGCTGVPVEFTAPANEITYTWVTDTVNINQTRGAFSTTGLSTTNKATFASTVFDNGTWYTFITYHVNNTMVRLTYSGDPNGAYTTSTVGTYGSAKRLEGVDIVKDSVTGDWYGLTADAGWLYVLSFGSSLANTPTSNSYNFSGTMSWPHQVGLAKYGNDWIGFIGDRNSTIKRVDFGTALTNTPTVTSIPNVGSVSNPCNFALHKEGGNWYMLVSSLGSTTVTLYNFGTNISNNTPTGTSLGNTGNLLNIPRSICIISDCDQLIAFVLNESSVLVKLDFGSSITNTPTATSTGGTGIAAQNSMNTYIVDTALYANIVSFGSNSLSRGRLISFPTYDTTLYYNDSFSHSFTSVGTKNMTLFVNQGSHMGSEAFCKQINIGNMSKILADTAFCSGDSVILDATASAGAGFTWSTGATTPSITVKSTGKYWVTISGPSCIASDTANVTVIPTPQVIFGTDSALCDTMQVLANTLPNPPGASFLWNTGSTTPTIPAKVSGKYWLHVTKDGCTGRDTMSILVTSMPDVSLGNDTGFCAGESINLSNRNSTLSGSSLLWSNGSTGNSISGISGKYWLSVSLNGCEASDTISIVQNPLPVVILGNDTFICDDKKITLKSNAQPQGTTYEWSTGSKADTLTLSIKGSYGLTVTDTNGCEAANDIIVSQFQSPFMTLGTDKDLCKGDIVRLPAEVKSNSTYSILWQNGSTDTVLRARETDTYSATITNVCGSAYDEVYLKFTLCNLFFPSAFSPNGDNTNDIARIRGDLEGIQKYELSIFHRRGQRVYNTTNPLEGWDGFFKDKPLGMDTYFYMIKVTYRGSEDMMTGDITLVR